MKAPSKLTVLLLLILALILIDCGRDPASTVEPLAKEGGIETVALSGTILLPGGSPAAMVTVRLRPASYLKDTSERLTKYAAIDQSIPSKRDGQTNDQGRFRFDSLPPADYRLEVRGVNGLGMLLPIQVSGEVAELILPPETLVPTAIVSGRIVPPRPLTDSISGGWNGNVYAQIYGEERIEWSPALKGTFSFRGLSPGSHRIRFSAGLDIIDSRELILQVKAGDSVDLGQIDLYSSATEDYSQWLHSTTLVMNLPSAGPVIEGLPLLIRLDSINFDFRQSDGKDIRFADRAGNSLPYQVERWDSAIRRADIWVKSQSLGLQAGEDYLTLFWGKAGAPDLSSGPRVFDAANGFLANWHLEESRNGMGSKQLYRDATGLENHGDDSIVGAPSAGIAGSSVDFTESDYIKVRTPSAKLMQPTIFTASAWLKATRVMPTGSTILSAVQGFKIAVLPNGVISMDIQSEGMLYMLQSPRELVLDGAWHSVVGMATGLEMKIFLDGKQIAGMAFTGKPTSRFAKPFLIGRGGETNGKDNWLGGLDEVTVCDQVRSTEWIRMAYENQRPDTIWFHFR
jgi:hypothetical protein